MSVSVAVAGKCSSEGWRVSEKGLERLKMLRIQWKPRRGSSAIVAYVTARSPDIWKPNDGD